MGDVTSINPCLDISWQDLTMMQKPCLWLKLSSPGKLLLDGVTLKVWSMQAAMQVFVSPWSFTVLYFPAKYII